MEESLGVLAPFQSVPTCQQLSSFTLTNLNVPFHRLKLSLIDDRSHFYVWIQAVTDSQRLCSRGKPVDKVFVNLLVHNHATGSSATLPRCAEATPDGTIHRQV